MTLNLLHIFIYCSLLLVTREEKAKRIKWSDVFVRRNIHLLS